MRPPMGQQMRPPMGQQMRPPMGQQMGQQMGPPMGQQMGGMGPPPGPPRPPPLPEILELDDPYGEDFPDGWSCKRPEPPKPEPLPPEPPPQIQEEAPSGGRATTALAVMCVLGLLFG